MIRTAGRGPDLSETKPVSLSNDPPRRGGRGPDLSEIEHQGWLLSPPTRLNSNAELFSMGLRPRLSADAAFAAFWNPGLAPGNF